jgi:hypothetical protein
MAKCVYCGSETELYVSGVPVCLSCSDAAKRKDTVRRKPPASQQETRNKLLQEVLEATAHHNEARADFEASMVPGGLPHPDGTQRIINASRRLSMARKNMMTAHNRLDSFLETGSVPGDLKRSG